MSEAANLALGFQCDLTQLLYTSPEFYTLVQFLKLTHESSESVARISRAIPRIPSRLLTWAFEPSILPAFKLTHLNTPFSFSTHHC